MKYYAIGDIHGCYELLEKMMCQIREHAEKHAEEYVIVFLGDYIDRGTRNLDVMNYLMNLQDSETVKHVFIRGNHEDMFINCTVPNYDYGYFGMWTSNGGENVLDELDVKTSSSLVEKAKPYRDWILSNTITRYETDKFFFCHAGIDPNVSYESQSDHYLMWNGRYTPDFYRNSKKIIVHGHLVSEKPIMDYRRIGIDLGSFCYNKLGAVYLDENNLSSIQILEVVN